MSRLTGLRRRIEPVFVAAYGAIGAALLSRAAEFRRAEIVGLGLLFSAYAVYRGWMLIRGRKIGTP